MTDGANTADAGGDVGGIGVAPAPHHRFEEARRFGHLPAQLLDGTVLQVNHDVAVSLNTGHVMDVNLAVFHLATSM